MTEVIRFSPQKARRLRETAYTDRGLRLPDPKRAVRSRWFRPAMILLPASAFAIVFFW